MEYYNLRLEQRRKFKNSYYTYILINLIETNFEISEKVAQNVVYESINTTNTPIQLLRKIQNRLKHL